MQRGVDELHACAAAGWTCYQHHFVSTCANATTRGTGRTMYSHTEWREPCVKPPVVKPQEYEQAQAQPRSWFQDALWGAAREA